MANAPVSPKSAPSEPWTSPQYEAALAHLERLQNQLDALRTAPTNSLSPLQQRSPGKAQMFASLKKTAVTTTEELKDFRQAFESERTQEILSRAAESEGRDGDLARAREVQAYGWDEKEENGTGSS